MVCSVRCLRRKLSPTICFEFVPGHGRCVRFSCCRLRSLVNSLLPIVFGIELGPMSYCFILSLEAFRLGGLVVAVLHLLALAINHYIGILRPLHYAHIVTRETTVVGIVIMWIFPVVFFLVYFSSIPNDGFQAERCTSYNFLLYSPFRVTTSVMFFFPLVLMTLMYSHMFVVVRQHQKGLLHCPSTRQLHKNVKAIITTLLILGTYILGWMPAVLFFVLTCLDCSVPFTTIPLNLRVPVGIFINSMIVAKSFCGSSDIRSTTGVPTKLRSWLRARKETEQKLTSGEISSNVGTGRTIKTAAIRTEFCKGRNMSRPIKSKVKHYGNVAQVLVAQLVNQNA
ncbi:g_PROTEIN_RECEP_F1_2 domain-containing protein [Caerostris extrusa]|uniref:G_PROTEIN_RECEP_F1_2 domain-containing protein n=1 Tax=Caerostris extrusa TaxID=172846 RepID=A0AAV4MZY5_CAEEX|nr:g_PROTEIN_RECEP_F1_2 domain-containing protein [Caerostris extrusa]